MKVELRPASSQDAEPIADLQIAAWKAAFTPILPADYVMPEREAFLAVGGWPSVTTVAEMAGAVAGFCGHGPSRDEGAGPLVSERVPSPRRTTRRWPPRGPGHGGRTSRR